MSTSSLVFCEPGREVPVVDNVDVIVCGAGPAGIAAALAAARSGASTVLIEVNGCLGGVWTAGLLSWIIDSWEKGGIMQEIIDRLDERNARRLRRAGGRNFAYDVEEMKLLLEKMMAEAGVQVQLHTRVCSVGRTGRNLDVVLTESKSGRQAWRGKCFVDATGDGDLAARAGCGYDCGRPSSGECQPMSLLTLLTGIDSSEVEPFIGGSMREPKERLLAEFSRAGVAPSYSAPTLFMIREGLFSLMANHEYDVPVDDAGRISDATMHARAEVNTLVDALRSLGGVWKDLKIVATAEQIGVREGRRIHGRYTVSAQDMIDGVSHEDSICHVRFGIDVHATSSSGSRNYDKLNETAIKSYDIPLRALLAKDVDNLLLAGRCISGDFIAHSSYRVTGNAVVMGQAAGVVAALSVRYGALVPELPWPIVEEALGKNRSEPCAYTVNSCSLQLAQEGKRHGVNPTP